MERHDGQLGFILQTTWDTATDADEFGAALGQGLRKRFGANQEDSSGTDHVLIRSAGPISMIVKRGSDVLLVMGPDEASLTQAANALGF